MMEDADSNESSPFSHDHLIAIQAPVKTEIMAIDEKEYNEFETSDNSN